MSRLVASLLAIALIVALSAAGFFLLQGFAPETPTLPPREVGEVPVKVRTLDPRDIPLQRRAFGTLEARREAHLAFEVGGRVIDCLEPWNAGQRVVQGERLVRLDGALLDLEVTAAEAALEEASAARGEVRVESDFADRGLPLARQALDLALREEERQRDLFASAFASDAQLDAATRARTSAERSMHDAEERVSLAAERGLLAQARHASAQAALDAVLERRTRLDLFAPFDGALIDGAPALGSYFAPGQQVARLLDTAALRVQTPIFEADLPGIEVGQLARVSLTAQSTTSYEGQVLGIGVLADARLRSVPVEIEIPGPDPARDGTLPATGLRAGMFVEVVIDVGIAREALRLARDEFVWRDGSATAFVLVGQAPNLSASARRLELGEEVDGGYLVIQGLQPGEILITAPIGRLAGGEPCRLRESREE